ncbi:uncharacterized protein LOC101892201 [Musca domestica]|uniref:Uncharacterized protein LOC101892201 n=1 Tax=Musca domestica TaxID=7370 RepID=A0A1I8MHE6_MUSDO|nr:uncharacterized protein LOC101892201 [Musca domestica]
MFAFKLSCALVCSLVVLSWLGATAAVVIPANQAQHNFVRYNVHYEYPIQQRPVALAPQTYPAPPKFQQNLVYYKNPEVRLVPRQQYAQQAVQAPSAAEPKNLIYVLVQDPNYSPRPIQQQASQQIYRQVYQNPQLRYVTYNTQPAAQPVYQKPEVRYVTYNQPADAERIKAQIIQQYGGNVQISYSG